MKKCKKCGKEKEDWEFPTTTEKSTGREYTQNACRACARKKDREVYNTRARQREKKYGITKIQFELMLKAQDNKCIICGCELVDPCVDHCHKTYKIRGILCQKCNRVLGVFNDSPELLRKAATYLEKL